MEKSAVDEGAVAMRLMVVLLSLLDSRDPSIIDRMHGALGLLPREGDIVGQMAQEHIAQLIARRRDD